MAIAQLKALAFDVFGTVVDYRSTIIAEGELLNQKKGLTIDWAAFADAWRSRYHLALDQVRNGEIPWTTLDVLHARSLAELLTIFQVSEHFTEEEKDQLNRVWHRLQPWPDSIAGLTRLRQHFTLATLSNGNMALLVNMAKHSGLPWDCILSSELFRTYKPDPVTYLTALDFLGLRPEQVMMVAAHQYDLRAAKALGLKTAFVRRPLEFGPAGKPDLDFASTFDINATDFIDLADQLTA